MKRPLKPSEVPPGSEFQYPEWTEGRVIPSQIFQSGIVVAETTGNKKYFWDDLKEDGWKIKRPGEDWQECAVDEFNPADYKPGQEVDVETARKLFDAGVKLEYAGKNSQDWIINSNSSHPNHLPDYCKFRISAPPKLRPIEPDKLPERFEVVWPDGRCIVTDRRFLAPKEIAWRIEEGAQWRTDLNATELKSFTVEDK